MSTLLSVSIALLGGLLMTRIFKLLKLVSDADLSYSLVSMRKLPDNRLKMEFAVSFMENFNMFEFVKNAAENEFVEAVYSE